MKKQRLSMWEFWSRSMTVAQFLIVVGVGTYLTVSQMNYTQKSLYAENMLRFDDKLSEGNNARLIDAIEDNKPILIQNKGLYTESDLEELLGVYEDLYKFYQMGLISKDLIYNDFSYDLILVSKNQEIRNYLIKVRKEDPTLYTGIDKLLTLFNY